MMPQALAAMSFENDYACNSRAFRLPRRADFQYRDVGPADAAVRDDRCGDSGVAHRGAGIQLRILHLFAVHEHEHAVYADVNESQTASASTIASTMQQMSISFGVASASLVTAIFIPDASYQRLANDYGIHEAFLILGALTIVSRSCSASCTAMRQRHQPTQAILPTG